MNSGKSANLENANCSIRNDQITTQNDEFVAKKKRKREEIVIPDYITTLGGNPPLYCCNICRKKFKTKAHYKYHDFCETGNKPFSCEKCGQGFISKNHFEYHIRTHTGEKPFSCKLCHKKFNQQGKVNRHMRSHTGEKPHACNEPQCNKRFSNAKDLKAHTIRHSEGRLFVCEKCNKWFYSLKNLRKHRVIHSDERKFGCDQCGKRFKLKWTLGLHLKSHSDSREHKCDFDGCKGAFTSRKDLQRHRLIHKGVRPWKCWLCGVAFLRRDNLIRHIEITHKKSKEIAKQLSNEVVEIFEESSVEKEQPSTSAAARQANQSGSSTHKYATEKKKKLPNFDCS
ncbi:putative zinc finger protein [Orchesella cincta]|uniref:Putative zinc finger protein n=1 Tax=Orchesella cincta TaxID=48709 RepID=A0A1D2M3M1_ORCCI|nr:putative zinc finger protein [Orchesella cincta]